MQRRAPESVPSTSTPASTSSTPSAPKAAGREDDTTWATRPEKGSALGARVLLWTLRLLGRRGAGALLRVIVFYYALFARAARRASAEYLRRAGQPHGFWASYQHILAFARCALDRVLFVQGEFSPFTFSYHGHEHLERMHRARQGAILLGAHVGSFEAMRAAASSYELKINILAYFENARMISSFLAELGADFNTRVIAIKPGDPSFMFAVRDAIERGEFVAVLGDRVGLGEKTVTADFFGARARFPAGPYTLAAVLRCPVYLTFGLFRAPNHYDLYCEPFSERLELPRGQRERALAAHVQRYADRLEHYCRQAPRNWFNFFDFWRHAPDGDDDADAPGGS